MSLPARSGDVSVRRTLDVTEEDLIETITAFATDQDLELDRRHEGPGLLFTRAEKSTKDSHLFKRGDSLQVQFATNAGALEVEFLADLSGSRRKRGEAGRSAAIRQGALAALFAYLGVRGLIREVGIFDFVWLGLSARFGFRAGTSARSDADLDEVERKVANELNAVCDDALYD